MSSTFNNSQSKALAFVHMPVYLSPFARIVESTGARMFGLDEHEAMERRRYVEFVRQEIDVRPPCLPCDPQLTVCPIGRIEHACRSRIGAWWGEFATAFAYGHAEHKDRASC